MATNRAVLLAAGVALVVLLAGGGIALALTNNNGADVVADQRTAGSDLSASADVTSAAVVPADEQCTDAIKSNPRWVCLTKATISDSELRIEYVFNDGGTPFTINGGYHLHIYGASADGSDPSDAVMGSHASHQGHWFIDDAQPSVHKAGSSQYATVQDYPKVCARIARSGHQLVVDTSGNGTYLTGNCVPLTVM